MLSMSKNSKRALQVAAFAGAVICIAVFILCKILGNSENHDHFTLSDGLGIASFSTLFLLLLSIGSMNLQCCINTIEGDYPPLLEDDTELGGNADAHPTAVETSHAHSTNPNLTFHPHPTSTGQDDATNTMNADGAGEKKPQTHTPAPGTTP